IKPSPIVALPVATKDVPSPKAKTSTLTYGIVAQNSGVSLITHVRVEHELPTDALYLSSQPPAERHGNKLLWNLGTLKPGAKMPIKVHIRPALGIEVPPEARATFSLYQCLQSRTPLTRPRLTAALTGLETIEAGEPVAFHLRVTNQGSATARNVAARL